MAEVDPQIFFARFGEDKLILGDQSLFDELLGEFMDGLAGKGDGFGGRLRYGIPPWNEKVMLCYEFTVDWYILLMLQHAL